MYYHYMNELSNVGHERLSRAGSCSTLCPASPQWNKARPSWPVNQFGSNCIFLSDLVIAHIWSPPEWDSWYNISQQNVPNLLDLFHKVTIALKEKALFPSHSVYAPDDLTQVSNRCMDAQEKCPCADEKRSIQTNYASRLMNNNMWKL